MKTLILFFLLALTPCVFLESGEESNYLKSTIKQLKSTVKQMKRKNSMPSAKRQDTPQTLKLQALKPEVAEGQHFGSQEFGTHAFENEDSTLKDSVPQSFGVEDSRIHTRMQSSGLHSPGPHDSRSYAFGTQNIPHQDLEVDSFGSEPLKHNFENTITSRRVTTSTRRDDHQNYVGNRPPALQLTKGELAALYETALSKGKTIKFDAGNHTYTQALVHELPSSGGGSGFHDKDNTAGYYYYYYPLKSFLDDPHEEEYYTHGHHRNHDHHTSTHVHEHNVYVAPLKHIIEGEKKEKKKGLEPLFMAISGFVGMAVMFVISTMVLPKFKLLKSRQGKGKFSPELSNLAKTVLMAVEGKGCMEKYACELKRTTNRFHIFNNGVYKFLQKSLPVFLRKKLEVLRRYSFNNVKCSEIKCNKPKMKDPAQKSQR